MSNDLVLVEAIINGDKAAAVELFERAIPIVRGLARRLAGEADKGDDLAQEAFLAAMQNLKRYRGTSAFSTWVCGIVLHKHQDMQRRQAKEAKAKQQSQETDATDLSDMVIRKDTQARIWSAIADLPKTYHETLIAWITSADVESAAGSLGLSTNAFRVRLHRAREKLKDTIRKNHPDLLGEIINEGT